MLEIPLRSSSAWYRMCAEEMRTKGESMTILDVRADFAELAEQYERQAERALRWEKLVACQNQKK